MHVIAFNGSPRKDGNTSHIIKSILEGVRSAGAETTEVLLHHINMKGCMGCLSCRSKPGICAQKDDLSPHLDAIMTCDAVVLGCPIYMYRISGQMKMFVDRCYSLYVSREGATGYDPAVPPGKNFGMVISQGAADPNQYHRSIRWLAGMGGAGFGMEEVGRIIHTGSTMGPAESNKELLEEAFQLGLKLVGRA